MFVQSLREYIEHPCTSVQLFLELHGTTQHVRTLTSMNTRRKESDAR
jgi:hypothetical protein